MAGISLLQMLAVLFFGVFGQLYVRIFVLEGSLDKIWLMFFCIPPFSLVPALMMYFGSVSKGQGGKPYDMFMWLPTLLAIVCPMLTSFLDRYNVNSIIQVIIETIIPLFGGMIAFYLRDYNNCDEKMTIINKKITQKNKEIKEKNQEQEQEQEQELLKKMPTTNNLYYKSFSNALIAYSIATIAETVISFIPIIGWIIRIIQMIPVIGSILSGLFYVVVYILVNMYNNINAKSYCLDDGYGTARTSITIFSAVIFVFILVKDILLSKLFG